jgi:hypothetical protein
LEPQATKKFQLARKHQATTNPKWSGTSWLCSSPSPQLPGELARQLYIYRRRRDGHLYSTCHLMAEGCGTSSIRIPALLLLLGCLDLVVAISLPYPLINSIYRITPVSGRLVCIPFREQN